MCNDYPVCLKKSYSCALIKIRWGISDKFINLAKINYVFYLISIAFVQHLLSLFFCHCLYFCQLFLSMVYFTVFTKYYFISCFYMLQAIVPVFTENIREAFRAVSLGRRLFLRLYALTKLPFAPIYGGFPVKLVTHVGKPIPYEPNLTPEMLQTKVSKKIYHTFYYKILLVLLFNFFNLKEKYTRICKSVRGNI